MSECGEQIAERGHVTHPRSMRVTGVGDADGISDAPAGCILLQAEFRLAKLHYALQRI